MSGKKILLGQLGRRGDCLYATTIARQIKKDFPGSRLTWAVSSVCRTIIEGNPYVDRIWEVPVVNGDTAGAWHTFAAEALYRKEKGEFDEIFLTQVHPGNFQNYDGTSRSSIFRGYPGSITVPVQPVVRLTDSEVANVRRFADLHRLPEKKHVILFECASTSGQSFVDQKFAVAVARRILNANNNACFILSSDKPLLTTDAGIIDGSVLSFKENAELTKYCSLLVGCSSGISWLATSDWAKPLPKIQLLNASTVMYASMFHDALFFGLPTEDIIEMQNCNPEVISSCVTLVLDSGFSSARRKYHHEIPVNFTFYFKQVYWEMLRKHDFIKAASSLAITRERFGRHTQLERFIHRLFFSYLTLIRPRISEQDLHLVLDRLGYRQTGKSPLPPAIIGIANIVRAVFNPNTWIVGLQLIRSIVQSRVGMQPPGRTLERTCGASLPDTGNRDEHSRAK